MQSIQQAGNGRKVVGMGETVLDIVFKDNQPRAAVAGGSVLNTMVSLARSGAQVALVSEVGDDRVGANILSFLSDNGVCTDYMARRTDMKSPVSMAFLDSNNEAEYAFYRDKAVCRTDVRYPDLWPVDIVAIGSFFAVNPAMRPVVEPLLRGAKESGALVYYDLNYREAHRADLPSAMDNILANMASADIVRASRDDLRVVFGTDDAEALYRERVGSLCRRMVVTNGAADVVLLTPDGPLRRYAVPRMSTVSTIGAGDNFNAGLLFGLLCGGIAKRQLDEGLAADAWDHLVRSAMEFSAASCKELFNYVPRSFGDAKRQLLQDSNS